MAAVRVTDTLTWNGLALLAVVALLTSCTGDGTTLDLFGEPLGPPVISVEPADGLDLSMIEGTSRRVSLEISNGGGLPLRVSEIASTAAFLAADFSGTLQVPSGETATVAAIVTATDAAASPLEGTLEVISNDPEAPMTPVPVHVVVTLIPVPEIEVSPDSLTVRVAPEGADVAILTIRNTGTGPLTISDISSTVSFFSPGLTTATVEIGDSLDVVVTGDGAGMAAGEHLGSLDITSDDEDEGLLSVPILLSVESPFPATLRAIQDSVFTPRCSFSGCHALPAPAVNLLLAEGASFGATVNVLSQEVPSLFLVEPANGVDSYIVIKMRGSDPRRVGMVMPPIGSPLDAEVVDVVSRWIDEGAQQN